jgi:ketosteroid isomerase-like protein/quercetin dioxygenase-like cupin family protein
MSDPGRLIRDYYDGRARGDRAAVEAALADDVAWHDPYPPPHGGDLVGRTAVLRDVFDAAGELTAGTGRFWLVDLVAIGMLAVALVGWTAEYRRRRIETRELAVYRVADDRIAEAWFYPEDPEESWRFFADPPGAELPAGLSGTPYRFMDQLVRVRATADQTRGAFGLVDIETPSGSGPLHHRHARDDEVLVVLRGRLLAVVGDERTELSSGDLLLLPKRIAHGYRASAGPLRHMNLVCPGGFEQFFAEADRRVEKGSQLDPTTLGDLAAQYGVTLLGRSAETG